MECELERQREAYADQRQQELDTLDMERYTLQEMEDQERINALVQQVCDIVYMCTADLVQHIFNTQLACQ